jgi:hypothetical protein
MSLAEIKDAVTGLTPRELAELTQFILERDAPDAWDKQMEKDAAAGKLDFLIEEAEREEVRGDLRAGPGKAFADRRLVEGFDELPRSESDSALYISEDRDRA